MSGTITFLNWAFELRDIDPESKLVAIHLAGLFDQDGMVTIDPVDVSDWCGFVSSSNRWPRPKRVQAALQGIKGISYDWQDDSLITIKLEVKL